ncbi:MAG: hypothetical protein HY707_02845 [Ignavibacteriae bacterium]|nr:hypothetical protein [Ignavibacteriota bacterium]
MKTCTKVLLLLLLSIHAVHSQTWVQKVAGGALGNPLAYNPLNRNILYGSPGNSRVYISRTRGYTWQQYGNAIPGGGVIKSIAVNPLDTLHLLVGVEMSGITSYDRIMKTTDGGLTWTQTWGGTFNYYGRPVEFKPEHPDTVYTMGNDTLWSSTNFGTSWDTVRRVTGLFNAWCDAEVRPDSANIIYIGDNASGIWKTTDYGVTWMKVYTTLGEIPSIAIDPFNPRVAYATKFSGGGGVVKTTDGGETWFSLTTPIGAGSTWWITCSQTDPGYVYFGTYGASPPGIYISRDSGSTWQNLNSGITNSNLLNYGLLCLDSLAVIALQSNGIYRLQYPAAVQLLAPNGGEFLQAGVDYLISWTASYVHYLRLQYSTNNGANWNLIADPISVAETSYSWTVPFSASSQCRVRISDVQFSSAIDISDTTFTIYYEPLTLTSPTRGEVWYSGSVHSISWVAYNIDSVDLHYSTDSGSTWNWITKQRASLSTYSWSVPNTPSTSCKIRVRSRIDTTLVDQGDSLFTIVSSTTFRALLHLFDNGSNHDSLEYGAQSGATDGIDTAYGEATLPPKPPEGSFDVRWRIVGTEGTKIDIRDTLSESDAENLFIAETQPGLAGYPFILSWDPDSLHAGMYILRDTLTHGSLVSVDMRKENSLTIVDSSITAFEIKQCRGNEIFYPGDGGWTLISLPVETGDRRTSSLFPYSASPAFAYVNGYIRKDTLEYGRGYWLKTDQTSLPGCPRTFDTIDVRQSWNIIGSLSSPVPVSSIVSIPESIIISSFYGYGGGYFAADTIRPGEGYWVKTNSPGKLVLSSGSWVQPTPPLAGLSMMNPLKTLNTLTVSDGGGNSQTLYFGVENSEINLNAYELPPPPPGQGFDARFLSQRMTETHAKIIKNELELPILIQSASEKIYLSWGVENEENFTYILVERSGGEIVAETRLTKDGSLTTHLSRQSTYSLKVQQGIGGAEHRREFRLDEIYPNPFNPTAHIRYSVPSDAHVHVKVFSVLGEEVTTLLEEVQKEGEYRLEWNGKRANGMAVSSGIYYIRMTARLLHKNRNVTPAEFFTVRKVAFIK